MSIRHILATAARHGDIFSPSGSTVLLFNRLGKVPKEYPFACQLGIATVKTSMADILVQTSVEKKKFSEIDVRRNLTFLLFGFGYLGTFQYWLLIHKYKSWFPSMKRFGNKSLRSKLKDTAGLLDATKVRTSNCILS
jgi:hypothetical protein